VLPASGRDGKFEDWAKRQPLNSAPQQFIEARSENARIDVVPRGSYVWAFTWQDLLYRDCERANAFFLALKIIQKSA
jgi:hypothetical protein